MLAEMKEKKRINKIWAKRKTGSFYNCRFKLYGDGGIRTHVRLPVN